MDMSEVRRLRRTFEVDDETVRPFRLWDATAQEFLRWRYYSDDKRAHIGALIECRWSKIGATIEVVDVSVGRMLGSYTRGVNDIKFFKG
jgi:hypothetical protein